VAFVITRKASETAAPRLPVLKMKPDYRLTVPARIFENVDYVVSTIKGFGYTISKDDALMLGRQVSFDHHPFMATRGPDPQDTWLNWGLLHPLIVKHWQAYTVA
jgi:hypothetical protein